MIISTIKYKIILGYYYEFNYVEFHCEILRGNTLKYYQQLFQNGKMPTDTPTTASFFF